MNTTSQSCHLPQNRETARTKEPVARVKPPKLPTIKAVAAELTWKKRFIEDDYRESADDLPNIDVTLATNCTDRDSWAIQTGDNSYTGCAYGFQYWGVSALYRRSNCRELAKELIEQIAEQWWQNQ